MLEKVLGCTAMMLSLIPFGIMLATNIEQSLWMFIFCGCGMLIAPIGIACSGKNPPVTALLGFITSAVAFAALFLVMGSAR